ncbi:hypothetical protein UC34_22125 [Pandoraea vervacti]|uniref:Uncharacterized protein n=1 Tax=Pandoraea vervacti TaxID=656178 RepID=A0ABM5T222_9BURK|nr:hypothetical protein [Pandoraea vervacti]AJP58909.1 hypothetical protein UC34_22125 [Pandoraea vervacti]
MQRHFWIATAAVAGLAAAFTTSSAFARTDVSVNIGIPGPAFVAPAPMYAPPPVVYGPAPVVVAPPPVVYGPPPRYWRGPPPRHWHHERGWERRDWDRRDWHHRR